MYNYDGVFADAVLFEKTCSGTDTATENLHGLCRNVVSMTYRRKNNDGHNTFVFLQENDEQNKNVRRPTKNYDKKI